eukprot:g4553.t1
MQAPIDFKNLWGRGEYEKAVAQLYRRKPEGWHTPVEVFAPWYSRAIARYMLHQLRAEGDAEGGAGATRGLEVVEIGGGSGANALCILDYLREHAPAVYERSAYTVVEMSRRLAHVQRDRLVGGGHMTARQARAQAEVQAEAEARAAVEAGAGLGGSGGGSGCQCRVLRANACDDGALRAAATGGGNRLGFVVALEVLDNLPHDKVVWDAAARCWLQARVAAAHPRACEVLEPASDAVLLQAAELFEPGIAAGTPPPPPPLLGRCINAVMSGRGLAPPVVGRFLPSGASRLLLQLASDLPHHGLVLADFSELPRSAWGADGSYTLNRPIVAGRRSGLRPSGGSGGSGDSGAGGAGAVVDHESYLDVSTGQADIFFATDFEALRRAHVKAVAAAGQGLAREGEGGGEVPAGRVLPSSAFLGEFGEVARTATLSGFNPMLEDFTNTAFLLTTASMPMSMPEACDSV